IALPIAGAVFALIALILGAPAAGHPDSSLAARLGDALGPLVGVAALAGCGELVRRRYAQLAGLACVASALLIDLRAGTVDAITLGLAALCCALGVARLAGSIRIASGQAIAAAACGWLLLLPAVWTIVNKLVSTSP